jgi:BirA family biotin operon repressor/biotin-[acetyl-CoA-carboxylase] ligase
VGSGSATDDVPWRVERTPETGSTNDDLVAAARRGEPDSAVLVTDHQTAGRGRLGRRWDAPPGANLLVSVLMRPGEGAAARLHGATQAVALAGRAACTVVAGFTPVLKWPNDLLVDDRKLAGILAEGVADGPRVTAVVVGMGLNVAWPPQPTDLAVSAASCADRPVEREALLEAFLGHLTVRRRQWEHDPDTLRRDYRAALGTLGRRVRVETSTETFEGIAVDIGPRGELVVDRDGERRDVNAADVVHLRPGGAP